MTRLLHLSADDRAKALDKAVKPDGSLSKAQLARWGVPWPPPQGWRDQLIEHGTLDPLRRIGWRIPDDFLTATTPDGLAERETVWFCLEVMARHEVMAALRLREMGLGVCLPLEVYSVRPRHRAGTERQRARRPLLPGYLFMGAEPGRPPRWSEIDTIDEVRGAVAFGADPVIVRWREIAPLLTEAAVQNAQKEKVARQVPVGASIRITYGPLAGIDGRVHRQEADGVRVDLGQCYAVIPLSHIEAAEG